MEPCQQCGGVFCTESVDEMDCASRCTCDKNICNGCNEECILCNAVLCNACLRDCAKCRDVFCDACENFLVKCEYCDEEYCLICCAKKTTCVGCGKTPSRPRLVEATAQLKRVQQGIQAGEIVPPVTPIVDRHNLSGGSAAEASRRAAEEERKQQELQDRAAAAAAVEEERKVAQEKAATDAAAKEQQELRRAAAAAREDRKCADKAAAMMSAATAEKDAATAGATAGGGKQERGTNMMPKKAKKKKGKKGKGGTAGAAPAPAAAPALAPVPAKHSPVRAAPAAASSTREMDHSVIKKWVLEVAARRTLATSDEIKRYFHGRVDSDVIDFYLEGFDNNCRATVIQCAEFLSIVVPSGDDGEQGALDDNSDGGSYANAGRDKDEEEGVNDDLVTGAFGAKERFKHGDYSAFEHPLEKRANEAKQNDCKDLNVLNAILAEAHGEVGLGKMKKMLKKMVKRITEEREEQAQLRKQNLRKAKNTVISQKLHPAYANKEPTYNSFQPPGVDRPPDAVMDIHPNVVGLVIGTNGARIKDLQQRTNSTMWVDQSFPPGEMRKLHIHGRKAQVEAAMREVAQLIMTASVNNRPGKMNPQEAVHVAGGLPPGYPDLRPSSAISFPNGIHKRTVLCPHALVGYLIGKKGVMIKRIKTQSQANVEVFQNLPDGVPRQVFITGGQEAVALATALVEEVIAVGIASDNSSAPSALLEHGAPAAGGASSLYGRGAAGGPVFGFVPTHSQATPASSVGHASPTPSLGRLTSPPSVGTITRDFGDLGGLGNGAAAATTGMNGHADPSFATATAMAIDNLHKAPPSLRGAGAMMEALPAIGIHEDFLAQQEAYRQSQAQFEVQQSQSWQQQQQQQPQQQQHAAAAAAAASGGGGGGGGDARPPFDSVEELLAKAGQIHLLGNFLEHEFDVNAIVLMTQQDFTEIGIPFGPQKKIQKAIREATARLGGAVADNGNGGAGDAAVDTQANDSRAEQCAICTERPIEVTFVGCGHFICCFSCGTRQVGLPCPICRIPVEECVQPYTG